MVRPVISKSEHKRKQYIHTHASQAMRKKSRSQRS